ncbi:transcriptional regulator [Nevskia ramosa]|uniref:transcriptional regulator n=1 Tax=Nevskia ramosa TaxID=64002 RepID=UPI0003B48241|nr:transcriptional regulator [Nevskia ramosa]
MFTVIETPTFSRLCADYWTEEERGAFAAWIAAHAEAGDVIPGAGGCRKLRWSRAGIGKRGGVRVIHYNQLADGRIYLLLIYAKGVQDNIAPQVLLKIKEALNAHD